ncbi:hypothetical protein QRC94_003799 [Vibrio vulnificus]|uniref:hypothetical protein n=1 Tax=Vibrio vulnificus TaxID=672 RepID=UPI002941B4D8|nr:hypothetical protein [Vibrio vulnificus]ELR8547978.1 hypothetical protein [Vibrio vulnificus]ELR8552732.1 hypothetical protein [Vibrio vulnificus]
MSTYQIISYCLMSWFFMMIGLYICVGLAGNGQLIKTSRLFKEFTLSYFVVMTVILFAAPNSDSLRELLWHSSRGGQAIGTLSILLTLAYSIPILSASLTDSKNNRMNSGEFILLIQGKNNERRYLSIDVSDMSLVMRSKRALLAEVEGEETVLDAACRIKDMFEKGGYDLVVVDTTGVGYALRETLRKHIVGTEVIASLPSDPVPDCHILPA